MTVAENADKIKENREIINKLSRIVVGNGEPGMDENVREIRKDLDTFREEVSKNIGVMQSDIKNLTVMFQRYTGQNQAIIYDDENHPNRRASDKAVNMGIADKIVNWFTDKILPSLFSKLIDTIVVIVVVLAVLHWEDIFK